MRVGSSVDRSIRRDRRLRTVYRCPACGRRIMWRFNVWDSKGGGGELEWQGNRAPVAYLDDDGAAVRCFACGWAHLYAGADLGHALDEGRL